MKSPSTRSRSRATTTGFYATVLSGEQSLPNGFTIRIEAEPDEHLPTGSVIDIVFHGEASKGMHAALEAQGIDATSAIVLAPGDRSFSVHFNSAGFVNGRASSYAGSASKPSLN